MNFNRLINTFAIGLKQLPSPSPFGKHRLLNVGVTAATLESNTLVATGLNQFYGDNNNNGILAP